MLWKTLKHGSLNSLASRTSPNAQPIQTGRSVRDLGFLLNTGFSADDNVARATKKARGMFFYYLKRSFAALTPSIFLPFSLQYKNPPPFSPGIARR